MYHPPQKTNKHIPVTGRGWLAEVEGIRHLLEGLDAIVLDQGQDWVDSVISYYTVRMQDLLDHCPQNLCDDGTRERIWREFTGQC